MGPLSMFPVIDNEYVRMVEIHRLEEVAAIGEKPAPVQLCPPLSSFFTYCSEL